MANGKEREGETEIYTLNDDFFTPPGLGLNWEEDGGLIWFTITGQLGRGREEFNQTTTSL